MSGPGGGEGVHGGHGPAGHGHGAGGRAGGGDRFPLAAHFESPDQQYQSGKMAMWIFLVTEVLLFSGLFCAYAVYRANHPEIFFYGHRFLDANLGALNTIILICSSFTMAWAVRAAQLGQRRLLMTLLALTLVLAGGFLGVKSIEYNAKWKHGLLWGKRFDYAAVLEAEAEHGGDERAEAAHPGDGGEALSEAGPDDESDAVAPPGPTPPELLGAPMPRPGQVPRNVHQFFGIYFVMTGLHALHVIVGMAVIGWLLAGAARGRFGRAYFTPVDLGGLYWHLVDIIWIFLFPLLYLIH